MLSLFALVPFLWRATKVGVVEAVVLGSMLAASYGFVAFANTLWLEPGVFLLQVLGLIVVFALYAVAVNRMVAHTGFNVFFVAASWLPLEYVLRSYINGGGFFVLSGADSVVVTRIASLFGILVVSFIVVLVNSLILVISQCLARGTRSCASCQTALDQRVYPLIESIVPELRWHYIADPRAPPSNRFA
jgi:apolipoprotein N-acyltransferase